MKIIITSALVMAMYVGSVGVVLAAPIPGSQCSNRSNEGMECYDQEGGSAFRRDIKAKCIRGVCQGQSARDAGGAMKGLTDALGLLNGILGLANNLKNLFAKPPTPPGAPPLTAGGLTSDSGANLQPFAPANPIPTGSSTPTIYDAADSIPADRITEILGNEPEDNSDFLNAVASQLGELNKDVSEVTAGVGNSDVGVIPITTDPAARARSELRKVLDGVTLETVIEERNKNTEIGGFYGVTRSSARSGTTPTSLVSRMCVNRPWATGIISRLIAASFFDNLCARWGYQVGQQAPPPPQKPIDLTKTERTVLERAVASRDTETPKKERGITCAPAVARAGVEAVLEWSCAPAELAQTSGFRTNKQVKKLQIVPENTGVYGIKCSDGFTDTCEIEVIRPRVAIWSEPKEVGLGARAIVYWNTEDVKEGSCKVTGPSFSETGLYGGASTVAINDPSTFTIECTAIDGTPEKAQTTVELSL
ncbi:MAG: hypothetical protein AAB421_03665 [Patescibacteria group bacterium]